MIQTCCRKFAALKGLKYIRQKNAPSSGSSDARIHANPHHINIGNESQTDSHRSGIIGYILLHEHSANPIRNCTRYKLDLLRFVSNTGLDNIEILGRVHHINLVFYVLTKHVWAFKH